MQYLKFTYRFLVCVKMISCCSCCVRDQYNTMALLSALCCHSISSWEPVLWQEFPAEGGLFWQRHLGLHWAAALAATWTSGKQPLCFVSLRVLFKSHLLWNVLQDWEIHWEMVPTSGRRGASLLLSITTFLTYGIGNRLTCSPKTRQNN